MHFYSDETNIPTLTFPETNKFQERLIVAAADVNEPEDELEQAEEEEDAAENEDIIEGMDEESGAAVETS